MTTPFPVSLPSAEATAQFESMLKQFDQLDIPVQHDLSGGMYARTGLILAGTTLIGATHKTDHINIVNGDIVVTTDDGMKRLTGYQVLPTKAGMKRVGYAITDTWWTTICRTDLTDISAIENEIVVESEQLQTRAKSLAMAETAALPLGE